MLIKSTFFISASTKSSPQFTLPASHQISHYDHPKSRQLHPTALHSYSLKSPHLDRSLSNDRWTAVSNKSKKNLCYTSGDKLQESRFDLRLAEPYFRIKTLNILQREIDKKIRESVTSSGPCRTNKCVTRTGSSWNRWSSSNSSKNTHVGRKRQASGNKVGSWRAGVNDSVDSTTLTEQNAHSLVWNFRSGNNKTITINLHNGVREANFPIHLDLYPCIRIVEIVSRKCEVLSECIR